MKISPGLMFRAKEDGSEAMQPKKGERMQRSIELELGFCYEVELSAGRRIQFRVLGGNPMMVEVPPLSGNKVDYTSLFTSYAAIRRIKCPKKGSES